MVAVWAGNAATQSMQVIPGINCEKKMQLENFREVRRSATSVMMSMIVHVAFIVAFAFLFWPAIPRPGINLNMQSPLSEMMSTFESEDLTDWVEEQLDDALFESSKIDSMESLDSVQLEMNSEYANLYQPKTQLEDLFVATPVSPSSAYQQGFFGIPATGNRIVYVIDISPSMAVRNRYRSRYQRAIEHVMYSVEQLQPDQQFFVFLFSFQNFPMEIAGEGKFCYPSKENIEQLRKWLESVRLSSGTDPRVSLVQALQLRPTCVFLLSDGEFNGEQHRNGIYRNITTAVELCKEHNTSKCPIHTVGLEDLNSQSALKAISANSGGVYQFVAAEE